MARDMGRKPPAVSQPRTIVRVLLPLAAGVAALILAGCVGNATSQLRPGSAEEASTRYISAVLEDDSATVNALTEDGTDLGTPAELRSEYLRLGAPVVAPVAFTLIDRFNAGEEPGHEGLRYRVEDASSGRVIGELTVYVGLGRRGYFVWGIST